MQAIAEVISSSITNIVAECPRSPEKTGAQPYFGSFVCVKSQRTGMKYIAVVYNITRATGDNAHTAVAFGLSREQLLKEQPQIFLLLQTQIHAYIIGFSQSDRSFAYLPPHPPDVHDFVYFADELDLRDVVKDLDFLRLLSEINTIASDELLAAAVREAYLINNKDQQFLLKAGQVLAQLFRSDSQRLLGILKRIQPAATVKA